MDFFADFDEWDLPGADTGDGQISIHGRRAGSGQPLVLLHGHPRTHTTWYAVAPLLVAGGCTMEDLYGDVPAVWQPWTEQPPHTAVIDSGHHMAEEAPAQLAAELSTFLRCGGVLL